MGNYVELNSYVLQDNDFNYHLYQETLIQVLNELLNVNGWRLPTLTTVQVNLLLGESLLSNGQQWYNTTDNLMQIMTNTGVRSINTSVWP